MPYSHRRPPARFRRVAAVAALTAGLASAGALSADAHVRVDADETASGSFSQLTFRVPNESDTAGTVGVRVELPQDNPFVFVSVKPLPGWTAKVVEEPLPAPVEREGTTITKAARTVTWTAEGSGQIAPGEYQEFSLSVGPLPAAGEVLLPATQTYSDKTVVSWDEPTPATGEEPEHPAPVLEVTAAVAEGAGTAASPAPTPATAAPAAPAAGGGGSDGTARLLGGAGLLAGLAALAVALLGRRRGAAA